MAKAFWQWRRNAKMANESGEIEIAAMAQPV